ncbi:MAG: Era-like GTP-binding protein [Pseudomonadota bacterium]
MKLGSILRLAVLIALIGAFALSASLVISLTDSTLTLWQRLQSGPVWLQVAFAILLLLALVGFGYLCIKILRPQPRRPAPAMPTVLDEAALRDEMAAIDQQGMDTRAVQDELARLATHRDGESLSIAIFGEVSTGKSSLAKALLPGANMAISPLAGSTNEVARYNWHASTGAQITLTDLPGLDAVGKTFDAAMLDEARRAHAVVFVVDGDLNRQQVEALQTLRAINKPLIVTLNKADRYDDSERDAILTRLQQRLTAETDQTMPALIVTIAGGEQRVVVADKEGHEHEQARTREADISQLVMALEELLGGDLATINALREHALLTLANEQLLRAKQRYRQQRAHQIVRDTTRKAVVGALAAVTPGTDLVIQGYLGTSMTRQLCRLYGQDARDIDIESFLDLSQSRVGKAMPVALAIAGNGLKAFPGAGTVAGGLVHSVAYGLIFDAVGRGLASTLERDETFAPQIAAEAVADSFEKALKDGVRRVARIALDVDER